MFTATLIAAETLRSGDISAAADMIRATGGSVTGITPIDQDIAVDLRFVGNVDVVRETLEHSIRKTDVIIQRTEDRARKLLIADMDSTMITIECIDELADYAGIKAEIAAVTESAMRGELDFEEALRSRVSLLKGLHLDTISRCLAERVRMTPGAKSLIRTFKAKGGTAILVSGGFTRFANPVAAELGFDKAIANTLGVSGDVLSGEIEGAIVGAETKRETLRKTATVMQLPISATIAIGDGANDIPMIEAAGLGIAYRAKPKAAAASDARIDHSDMSAVLYALGYPRSEWVDD